MSYGHVLVSVITKSIFVFTVNTNCQQLNLCTCTFSSLIFVSVYCKRGYFRWGKISRKCWQDISRGGNFHDPAPISFIKAYGFYFRAGVILAKKTKTRKLPPPGNFNVYSV